MNNKRFLTTVLTFIMLIAMGIVFNQTTLAAPFVDPGPSTRTSTTTTGSVKTDLQGVMLAQGFFQSQLGVIIVRFVEFALIVGSLAMLAMLIIGAIRWLTSGGDKGNYEAARGQITSAIVGLAILASAWAVWLLLLYFFGLNRLPNFNVQGSFSGGGRPATSSYTSSATGSNQCYPFSSCDAWKAQFKSEHGYEPTVGSGREWQDLLDSAAFARQYNRTPTPVEWNNRARTGSWSL